MKFIFTLALFTQALFAFALADSFGKRFLRKIHEKSIGKTMAVAICDARDLLDEKVENCQQEFIDRIWKIFSPEGQETVSKDEFMARVSKKRIPEEVKEKIQQKLPDPITKAWVETMLTTKIVSSAISFSKDVSVAVLKEIGKGAKELAKTKVCRKTNILKSDKETMSTCELAEEVEKATTTELEALSDASERRLQKRGKKLVISIVLGAILWIIGVSMVNTGYGAIVGWAIFGTGFGLFIISMLLFALFHMG